MPTVLVIDDDRSTRDAIEALLKRKNFAVVVASDGASAMQLLATTPVDVVLVDMLMPGMDGDATIRELVQIAPTVPLIAMSGWAFSVAETDPTVVPDAAMGFGATATLQKPFRADDLFEAIHRCLGPAVAPAAVKKRSPKRSSKLV